MSATYERNSVFRRIEYSVREFGRLLRRPFRQFPGSQAYWERRYSKGLTSGDGSRGRLAEFKSVVINRLLTEHEIDSAIEFGCGDGHQLGLIAYPKYTGFDVSPSAVSHCRQKYSRDRSKAFRLVSEHDGDLADLALSLDVIYHLVEDEVFHQHMQLLFGSARKLVVVYSTNFDLTADDSDHIRHRRFTDWVEQFAPEWKPLKQIDNEHAGAGRQTSSAEFFVFAWSS